MLTARLVEHKKVSPGMVVVVVWCDKVKQINARNRVHVLVVFSKRCSLPRVLSLQEFVAFENGSGNAKKGQFMRKHQFPFPGRPFRDSP